MPAANTSQGLPAGTWQTLPANAGKGLGCAWEKSLKEGHRLQVPLPAASREWDGKGWGTEGIMWDWVMEGPAEELELSE